MLVKTMILFCGPMSGMIIYAVIMSAFTPDEDAERIRREYQKYKNRRKKNDNDEDNV